MHNVKWAENYGKKKVEEKTQKNNFVNYMNIHGWKRVASRRFACNEKTTEKMQAANWMNTHTHTHWQTGTHFAFSVFVQFHFCRSFVNSISYAIQKSTWRTECRRFNLNDQQTKRKM